MRTRSRSGIRQVIMRGFFGDIPTDRVLYEDWDMLPDFVASLVCLAVFCLVLLDLTFRMH